GRHRSPRCRGGGAVVAGANRPEPGLRLRPRRRRTAHDRRGLREAEPAGYRCPAAAAALHPRRNRRELERIMIRWRRLVGPGLLTVPQHELPLPGGCGSASPCPRPPPTDDDAVMRSHRQPFRPALSSDGPTTARSAFELLRLKAKTLPLPGG